MKALFRFFILIMHKYWLYAWGLDVEGNTTEADCWGNPSIEFQEALIVMWCFA
jgi:hypothetical protein